MKLTKRQKVAKSIQVQFPNCSWPEALEWADALEKSESELNGRVGSFGEINESREHDESSYFKDRVRGKAGIKFGKESSNLSELQQRIAYRGGVRS